jgi:hypothetical protein
MHDSKPPTDIDASTTRAETPLSEQISPTSSTQKPKQWLSDFKFFVGDFTVALLLKSNTEHSTDIELSQEVSDALVDLQMPLFNLLSLIGQRHALSPLLSKLQNPDDDIQSRLLLENAAEIAGSSDTELIALAKQPGFAVKPSPVFVEIFSKVKQKTQPPVDVDYPTRAPTRRRELTTIQSLDTEVNRVRIVVDDLLSASRNKKLIASIRRCMQSEKMEVVFGVPVSDVNNRPEQMTVRPFIDGITFAKLVVNKTETDETFGEEQFSVSGPLSLSHAGLVLTNKYGSTQSLHSLLPAGILDDTFAGFTDAVDEAVLCLPPGKHTDEGSLENTLRCALNFETLNVLLYFLSLRWQRSILRLINQNNNTIRAYDDLSDQGVWTHRIASLNWIVAAPPTARGFRLRALNNAPGFVEHILTEQSEVVFETHDEYLTSSGTLGPYKNFLKEIDMGKPLQDILNDTFSRVSHSLLMRHRYESGSVKHEIEKMQHDQWHSSLRYYFHLRMLSDVAAHV